MELRRTSSQLVREGEREREREGVDTVTGRLLVALCRAAAAAAAAASRVEHRTQWPDVTEVLRRRRVSFAGMHAIGKLRPVTASTGGSAGRSPTARRRSALARGRRPHTRSARADSTTVCPRTKSVPPPPRCKICRLPARANDPGRAAGGGAKRARGKEFNSGRYYGGVGRPAVAESFGRRS